MNDDSTRWCRVIALPSLLLAACLASCGGRTDSKATALARETTESGAPTASAEVPANDDARVILSVLQGLEFMLHAAPQELRDIAKKNEREAAATQSPPTGETWSAWNLNWQGKLADARKQLSYVTTPTGNAYLDAALDGTQRTIASMSDFGQSVAQEDVTAQEQWMARYDSAVERLVGAQSNFENWRKTAARP